MTDSRANKYMQKSCWEATSSLYTDGVSNEGLWNPQLKAMELAAAYDALNDDGKDGFQEIEGISAWSMDSLLSHAKVLRDGLDRTG